MSVVKDDKTISCVQNIPVNNFVPLQQQSSSNSKMEDNKSLINTEISQFKSSLDKVERSIVKLVENTTSDKTKISKRLHKLNTTITNLKTSETVRETQILVKI